MLGISCFNSYQSNLIKKILYVGYTARKHTPKHLYKARFTEKLDRKRED